MAETVGETDDATRSDPGVVTGKLVGMAGFIGLGLVFQTLFISTDLYFVAGLGAAAIAGLGLAGNAFQSAVGAARAHPVAVGDLSGDSLPGGAHRVIRYSAGFLTRLRPLVLHGRIDLFARDLEIAEATDTARAHPQGQPLAILGIQQARHGKGWLGSAVDEQAGPRRVYLDP